MTLKFTQPYNDNKLVYDEKTHRYELTIEEIKNNFTITYNDDAVLTQRIKKNSRAVYHYIYAVGNTANRKIVEKLINNTEEGRQYIYDALFSQIEADLTTGFNSLVDQPRINLKTGSVIPEGEFVESLVSTPTKMILENSEYYVGLNVLYRGIFPNVYRLSVEGLSNE